MKIKIIKTKTLLLFAIFSIITIPACEKYDPYKQDKEQHYFFRCKVDGKEWYHVKYIDFVTGDLSNIFFDSDKGGIGISMWYWPEKNIKENIVVFINEGLHLGENKLKSDKENKVKYYIHQATPFGTYELDTTYHNNVLNIIDIDSSKHVIVGTFEFRVKDTDSDKTILINDGEFDFRAAVWVDLNTLRKKTHKFLRCKLNGKEWVSEYYPHSWYNVHLGRLDIKGKSGKDWDEKTIHMYVDNKLKIGENKLIGDTIPVYAIPTPGEREGLHFFLDSTFNNNMIINSIDSINHIITGKYQYRAIVDKDYPYFVLYDTAFIEDGEFDLKIDRWYE